MAALSKPSDINKIWADGGDVVSPSDVKIGLGWEVEVPPRQYFNWLDNKQDQFNAHVNQHGIPVWDSVTEYQAGKSYVQGSNGVVYVATQTHTNQDPVSVSTHWSPAFQKGEAVFETAGVTVWTVPLAMKLGIIKPKITVRSGGAGGGRRPSGGPGGGGGAEATGVVDLTGVTSVNITVGAGGIGILSPTNADGTNGGASSFGAYMSASGGLAGLTNAGGVSGTATGGSLNSGLGDGGSSVTNGTGAASGGPGGGPGGEGTSGGGRAGKGHGGGGGGAITNDAGNGVGGFVRIEW